MEARYGGTADHRRLSVDDALAPKAGIRSALEDRRLRHT
jgi:hypothetical protein